MTADAAKIFEVCQVSDRLFVLNPNFRRANFYAQQLRALALVEEMYRRKRLETGGRNVLVVGAGVAGLMVAAALVTVGANVMIVDQHKPLSQYRDANHRELHPNLIFWPFQELRAITDLPFLNWSCGTADKVAAQIQNDWDKYFAPEVTFEIARIKSIEDQGDLVVATAEDGTVYSKDLVVVAAGFMNERTVGTFKSPTYWTPNTMTGPAEVLVSGSGDGGLIDAAYQLFSIDAVATARTLAHALKGHQVEQDIMKTEDDALKLAADGDLDGALDRLHRYYTSLTIPPGVTNSIAPALRDENELKARLLHKEKTAYSPFTSPINKALISIYTKVKAGKAPRIALERGELENGKGKQMFRVEGAARNKVDTAKLLVRHGAAPAVYEILSGAQKAVVDSKKDEILANVARDEYEVALFRDAPVNPVAPSPSHKPENYYDELVGRVVALVSSATKSTGNVSIDRDRDRDASGPWEFKPVGTVRPDVRAMFPFSVGEIKITLADAPQPPYPTL